MGAGRLGVRPGAFAGEVTQEGRLLEFGAGVAALEHDRESLQLDELLLLGLIDAVPPDGSAMLLRRCLFPPTIEQDKE